METARQKAIQLLNDFKGEQYNFGFDIIDRLGAETAEIGKKVSIVVNITGKNWILPFLKKIESSLFDYGIEFAVPYIPGAGKNTPIEDVILIAENLKKQDPDIVISTGGGSTVDAVKAAIALNCLGDKYPAIENYFGNGQISSMLLSEKRKLTPHIAIMTAASSAAHLTKYSNVTDIRTNQKMLIIDEAIIPSKALFDYSLTIYQPHDLTIDGAMDGISHSLEVLMGIPESKFEIAAPVCLTGIELIVNNLKKVVNDPEDITAREAIALGTDLGGYAIMIGGTNGAHLNSFSFTDILSHGRACALMNPYYVVFFANTIGKRLKKVATIYKEAGYIKENITDLEGRNLGIALADGMINLAGDIGFPVRLKDVKGYSEAHKNRCLKAAKNPKLKSKLENMPVSMSASNIDQFMGSILDAAECGEIRKVKNINQAN